MEFGKSVCIKFPIVIFREREMSSEGENVTSTGPSQSGDGPQQQQNGSGQAPEGMDMLQKVLDLSLIHFPYKYVINENVIFFHLTILHL